MPHGSRSHATCPTESRHARPLGWTKRFLVAPARRPVAAEATLALPIGCQDMMYRGPFDVSYLGTRALRVLAVDESPSGRDALSRSLARDDEIEVVTAASATQAFDAMGAKRPDVLVVDVDLPGMGSMGILERVMSTDPLPVILACDIVHPSGVTALRGLDAGAVDIVQKPRLGAWGFYQESGLSLVQLVRAAESARPLRYPGRPFSPATPPDAAAIPAELPADPSGHPEVVVVGASMGGPAALKYLLARLPHDAPGMVIVQHLPAPFTPVLAAHLATESSFTVREAQDGDRVTPGMALIAPGGRHVEVQRSGTDVVVRVRLGTAGAGHYSSIDSLLVSAARRLGPAAIGVLLSGMGADGALGLLKMRQAGARTVVQDEDSSVHFELPRSAIQLGAVGGVLSLRRIAAELARLTVR